MFIILLFIAVPLFAEITAEKIDDYTMEVTKTVDTPASSSSDVTTYTYDFLLEQRERIQQQKDKDNALRDEELVEINLLISEADKIGIKIQPKEIVEKEK